VFRERGIRSSHHKAGLRTKKKPRQEGWRDQHVWVRGGRPSFSLDKEVGTSFASHKAKVAYSPKATKKPGAAGEGRCLPGSTEGGCCRIKASEWARLPRRAKERPPAADEASFLPRPQILDCGSAAAFRLQIQSRRAGIVPTEAGQGVGVKRGLPVAGRARKRPARSLGGGKLRKKDANYRVSFGQAELMQIRNEIARRVKPSIEVRCLSVPGRSQPSCHSECTMLSG
jgi:hypothetical protein